MVKSFLIIISIQIFLFSSEQIVLVVSDNFTTSKASLECYEDGKKISDTIEVNIGKNGLGWGLGEVSFKQNSNESIKKEGDKKAPIGLFKLTHIFGYEKKQNLNMPYLHSSKNLICVDDSKHKYYNQIISVKDKKPKSFEYMLREDNQYELGIVVGHNEQQIKQAGSCIFLHVAKSKDAPTAGCTSMSLKEITKIVLWLDESKNPILIQIPKSRAKEILKLYPQLQNSKLLKED